MSFHKTRFLEMGKAVEQTVEKKKQLIHSCVWCIYLYILILMSA